jgi:hypothetical protein
MTADVIALPVRTRRSPQDMASAAHRVLDATLAVAGQWTGSAVVGQACAVLDGAIDEFTALDTDAVHWEAVYPFLRDEADPHAEALRKAAEEADALSRALLVAIAVTCGQHVADGIKLAAIEGGTGGTE